MADEQITIASRSSLIVSAKSKKTYFTVDDIEGRRLLCFIPSLYEELPEGATVLVAIRPGRTENDTPSITGMATEPSKAIPHQTEKPPERKYGRDEDGTDLRTAVIQIGELLRAHIIEPDNELYRACDAWLHEKMASYLGLIKAYDVTTKEVEDKKSEQSPDALHRIAELYKQLGMWDNATTWATPAVEEHYKRWIKGSKATENELMNLESDLIARVNTEEAPLTDIPF